MAEESTGLSLPVPEVRSSSSYARSSPVLLVLPVVVAGVVGLAGEDVLAAVSEVHGRGLGVPQASVPVAASRGRREQEHSPRGGLELEVDVGFVGGHQVLEGLDGLVVLENLHRGDVVRGDVARSDAVAALEQVHAVDGQPRYRLGLVEYLPVVPDRDAGQLAEHVLDDQVLLGTEGCSLRSTSSMTRSSWARKDATL